MLPQQWKHRIIGAGLASIAASRADRWLAPLARGRGVILMFHHVRPAAPGTFQPNALLSITPGYLDTVLDLARRRGFDFVALDEVPARLAAGEGGPPFVALTFDDGYRDNRDHALPVLRRHGVPWTMFVTTDYAGGRGRLWWMELEEAIRGLDRLALPDGTERCCRTPAEKLEVFAEAYADLRAGPEPRLRAAIAGWCDAAGIDRSALVRQLCLGWDELADLRSEPGLTFGAHTLSHPMLAKHEDAFARREIVDGGRIVAERLGVAVRHLAYPVGDPGSAGPREFRIAAEAGYRTAVTTRPGHLFPAHRDHLTALPRVSVNGLHQSRRAMRALLSGVPFMAWNRGRRVSVD